MLRIRLLPTGRKNQPAYRFVVAEHSAAVQGKHIEVIGYYLPHEGKKIEVDGARVAHWVKMGAKPSETAAALFKQKGVPGMESFLPDRTKKKKRKKAGDEPEAVAPAPVVAAPVAETAEVAEAPAEAEVPAA